MTKNRLFLVVPVSFLLALVFGVSANAQYLISTKAGFINRVDGQVYILRGDKDDDKERATLGSQMENGDKLSVGDKGFAEALLNPGSYLRLDSNTEVRAVNIDLDTVRFELVKGSVIVEVGQIEKNTPIEIITPNGSLSIVKSGLQRIDVKDSSTVVAVRQGEVVLGPPSEIDSNHVSRVKSGKVVTLSGQASDSQSVDIPIRSDVAELNKDAAVDDFDSWSFDRAQALTAANVQAVNGLGSGSLSSTGWYYDPLYNFYTYVPGRSSFFSPYGFGFFNNYTSTFGYTPYLGYGFGPRAYTTYRGYYPGAALRSQAVNSRAVSGTNPGAVTQITNRPGSAAGVGFNHGGVTSTGAVSHSASSHSTSSSSAASHSTAATHSAGASAGVSHSSVGGGAARSR